MFLLLDPVQRLHTFISGARSIANCPSMSLLSVSAPAFSKESAVSPCPSEIALKAVSVTLFYGSMESTKLTMM